MTSLDRLRIEARVEELTAKPDDWTEVKIKLAHRDDVQGECLLGIWTLDAQIYYVGQDLCGTFSPEPLPTDQRGLYINASVQKISALDNARRIELKFLQEPRESMRGECRFRVSASESFEHRIRQTLFGMFAPAVNCA